MEQVLFQQNIGDSSTVRKDKLGALRWKDGVLYKYVEINNGTTVAGVAGDACVFHDATGYIENKASLDNSDADATNPIVAGFLTADITGTASTSYYQWVQITGVVTTPLAVTSGAIGSGVMMTTGGGGDKQLVLATGVINSCAVLLTASGANNKVIAKCVI